VCLYNVAGAQGSVAYTCQGAADLGSVVTAPESARSRRGVAYSGLVGSFFVAQLGNLLSR
jgi:hypothetical protein